MRDRSEVQAIQHMRALRPFRWVWRAFTVLSAIAATSAADPKYVPFGLNISPFEGTQDPSTGIILTSNQIAARLGQIKSTAEWVRTFSTTHGFETIGALAHAKGFRIAEGVWLGEETDAGGLAAVGDREPCCGRDPGRSGRGGGWERNSGKSPAASASSLIAYLQQVAPPSPQTFL
jgi:hypothetical protein